MGGGCSHEESDEAGDEGHESDEGNEGQGHEGHEEEVRWRSPSGFCAGSCGMTNMQAPYTSCTYSVWLRTACVHARTQYHMHLSVHLNFSSGITCKAVIL